MFPLSPHPTYPFPSPGQPYAQRTAWQALMWWYVSVVMVVSLTCFGSKFKHEGNELEGGVDGVGQIRWGDHTEFVTDDQLEKRPPFVSQMGGPGLIERALHRENNGAGPVNLLEQ